MVCLHSLFLSLLGGRFHDSKYLVPFAQKKPVSKNLKIYKNMTVYKNVTTFFIFGSLKNYEKSVTTFLYFVFLKK